MKTKWIVLFLFFPLFTASAEGLREERKGFAMDLGIGVGYTTISPKYDLFEPYHITGLNLTYGIGFSPDNYSRFLFGFKSHIFVDEVSTVWKNWEEKTEGDDAGASLAKIAYPFVVMFSPFFRSHSFLGHVEYTLFTGAQAPCVFLSATLGAGVFYDTLERELRGGVGLGAGAGLQFTRKTAFQAEVLYTPATEARMRAFTVTGGLKFFIF